MSPARKSKDKPRPRTNGGDGAEPARRIPAGRLPDISALSEDELAALIRLAERELAGRRDKKRAEFFASLRSQARALGVAPEEIAAELGRKSKESKPRATDRRATVAPKYRNPENPSETWAGRGVKPRWMQALLARGKSMDDFKIAR